MQKDSVMASFRSIVRRLDDHKETYVHNTIGRGRERLYKPYLTLLVNITPADLKPFVKAQSPLWRDGYIARFAFSTPNDSDVRETAFPEGSPTYLPCLISTLQIWHERLGIPQVRIESERDQRQQETRRYGIRPITPLAEKTYRLSPEVWQAYYAYDRAMRELIRREANHDLDGSYARFPMKALRVAGLLASLRDDSKRCIIELPHWYRGQQIAERWRRDLHRLVSQAHGDAEPSMLAKAEQRILSVIKKHGTLTVRDIQRWTKLAYADITPHLETLMTAGVVHSDTTSRTTKYRYVRSGEEPQSM
jgi:DNA-binding MarR family transcriptional regulator